MKFFLVLVFMGTSICLAGQPGHFLIEGNDLVTAVIHSSSGSNATAIDLIHGNQFEATDWRISNSGGALRFFDATDNFNSLGTENLTLFNSGTLLLREGSEASVGNLSGILVVGDEAGLNLAFDANEILARDDDLPSNLYIQPGSSKNTYINISGGIVGVGPLTVGTNAKMNISDQVFQTRYVNSEQASSSWYIGASNNSWLVGGDRLVISPTSSSGDAMFVIDDQNNNIDVKSNKIVNVADPVSGNDAVNKSYLESSVQQALDDQSFIAPKDLSSSGGLLTFAQCATRCRDLVQSGFSDWTVPGINDLSHYVGFPGIVGSYWTSDVEVYGYHSEGAGVVTNERRLTMLMGTGDTGGIGTNNTTGTSNCRCIR